MASGGKRMEGWMTIPCPIQRTATLLADRYVIMILRDLSSGPKRFNALETSGINPRTLSARLRHLQAVGLITRESDEMGYALTDKGEAFVPVLGFLRTYGERWLPMQGPLGPKG